MSGLEGICQRSRMIEHGKFFRIAEFSLAFGWSLSGKKSRGEKSLAALTRHLAAQSFTIRNLQRQIHNFSSSATVNAADPHADRVYI